MATFIIIYAFAAVTNLPDDFTASSSVSVILYLIVTTAVLTVALQLVQVIFYPAHYTISEATKRTLLAVSIL